MRTLFIFAVLIVGTAVARPSTSVIRQFPLDEDVVYTIPVPFDAGTTTILFPSPISALRASKAMVSPDQKGGQFLLSFAPGSYFFSIRALKDQAEDVLTVIYNRKAYIIKVVGSNNPIFTATFFVDHGSTAAAGNHPVDPATLLNLLDKAKEYSWEAEHEPESVAGIQYSRPARIMYYKDFRVMIDEVFRFEEQDTLIFRILLENGSDNTIYYDPQTLAVRVGDRIYPQSMPDASGVIPPRAVVPAYFAITGNAYGGRNNLSVDNTWNVLVSRVEPGKAPQG
jgi:hypothetical protein